MGHLEEHRPGLVAWLIPVGTIGVGLAQHCNAYLLHLVGMDHNIHTALMMLLFGVHCGRILWPVREAVCTIHKLLLSGWLTRVVWLWRCAAVVGSASASHQQRNFNRINSARWLSVGNTRCPS